MLRRVMMAAGGSAPPTAGYAGAVLADNPLIYLRMAELSGNPVNSGSVALTASTYSTSTRRQPSLCGDADDYSVTLSGGGGVSVRVEFANGVIKPNNFTMEAIIRPTNLSATRGLVFTGTSQGAYLRLSAGRLNMLRSQVQDMGSANTTLVAGTAYHVAVTVGPSGTTIFYVNGEADGTATPYDAYPGTTTEIVFGAEGLNFDHFAGGFDEGAYYGAALSPERIKAHAVAAGF